MFATNRRLRDLGTWGLGDYLSVSFLFVFHINPILKNNFVVSSLIWLKLHYSLLITHYPLPITFAQLLNVVYQQDLV
ncbi:MAG: hypothetical protein RLZZ171_403 [Cyanobacteriota bacterium]